MRKRLIASLGSESGETIVEALVAVLVSALAMLLLAGAVGSAVRIVDASRDKMEDYYGANLDLATPDAGSTGSAIITLDGKSDSVDVRFRSNDEFSKIPVTAYAE